MTSALDRTRELMRDGTGGEVTAAGYLDVIGGAGPSSTGRAQDLMLGKLVPPIYERFWRPMLAKMVFGRRGPSMEGEREIAQRLLELKPGDRVLDVASGPGNFTRRFAATVGADGLAVGIDASVTMLARGVSDTDSAALPSLAFVRGSATALPFPDQTFDALCCFGALHLFDDWSAALSESVRVLRPGGRLAIMTIVKRSAGLARKADDVAERSWSMRSFERDEVTSALERLGLTVTANDVYRAGQFIGARK